MDNNKRVKIACYSMNVAMAVVGNLPPLLFVTLHEAYNISYGLLGILVLLNFSTQLAIDVIFSLFSKRFNINMTVKLAPLIAVIGLLIFAVWPIFMPKLAYIGFVIGTVVFSASAGLAEVLLNPVIAALPSDNTERDLSMLHSTYAWGAVFVIVLGTLFLFFVGKAQWQWLIAIMSLVPLTSFFLYSSATLPNVETGEKAEGISAFRNKTLWICVVGIFLGGAIECTMAQWCSGYCEVAIGVPKLYGDLFGVALFSAMLGLGRTLYTKRGKNIEKVLILGVCGASVCYFVAAVSNNAIIGLMACAITGLCASMLWPGSIIAVSDRIPHGGVLMYALMAAGGDLGASFGPAIVGAITDKISVSPNMTSYADKIGVTSEQLGMKCAMLIGVVFSLFAIPIFIHLYRNRKTAKK